MNTKTNFQPEGEQFMLTVIAYLSKILETLEKTQAHDAAYYDSADVKRLLNISDKTLCRIRKSQDIPYIKIGGKIFYPKSFFNDALKK